MPPQTAFDRRVDTVIINRRWDDIANDWLNYLTSFNSEDPLPSIDSIAYPHFKELVEEVLRITESPWTLTSEVDGYRLHLFKEAIFLIRKSIHVLSIAEANINIGKSTWALSEGYQSAFFAAKAILSLFGINFVNHAGKAAIVDVWRKKEQKARKGISNAEANYEMLFIKIDINRIGHNHIWYAFQRLLRVCKVNEWPENYTSFLKNRIKNDEFSKQRDILHYSRYEWIFNDLIENKVIPQFAENIQLTDENCDFTEEMDTDFSVVLAGVLIDMYLILIKTMAKRSSLINEEYVKIVNLLKDRSSHPIYFKALGN